MQVKNFLTALLIIVFCTGLNAQTSDLVLQEEITPDYVSYLSDRETEWLDQVALGLDDAATMKAYMGLVFMAYAWTHIDGDTAFHELDSLGAIIEGDMSGMFDRIEDDIISMLDTMEIEAILTALTAFFDSGDYAAFRDFMDGTMSDLELEFDEVGMTFEDLFDDMDVHFAEENFVAHVDSIFNSSTDFEFSLQIVATDIPDSVMVFDRALFNHVDDLDHIGESMASHFDDFGTWMDSVMSEEGGDVMPGVASLRTGLDDMTEMLDTVCVILSSQPFSPFDLDTSPIDSIQDGIAEVDTLLGGKEYAFGPDDEGKTIKPLAILQNMPDAAIFDLYWEFYRVPDPENFTFGGIFPNGLDAHRLDLLAPDLVLNSWDDQETLELRLAVLEGLWEAELVLSPDDPDAHLGLAMIQAYHLAQDNMEIFSDIFRLLDAGRIDSLTYLYAWESVNFLDDLDEIDEHLSYFTDPDEFTHFVALIKSTGDAYGPYEIGPGTEFEIANISMPMVVGVQIQLGLVRGGLGLIVDGITAIYDELDDIFVLNLDPTVLDFSTVESDSDLVLMLELSNPDFLSLTPYGVDQFIAAGDALEAGFADLNEFFALMMDLAYAMQPYQDDFDMDGDMFIDDMEMMEAVTFELWQDFAYPDSMINIGDEDMNLSAWFDNPPASFLQMWKDYVFGIDSTWGGLFPDRYVGIDIPGSGIRPRKFRLHSAYPNPFNPVTVIPFDIPWNGYVEVSIYNVRGEQVRILHQGVTQAGRKALVWNAAGLPSDLYLYRVSFDGQSETGKVLLLK